MRAITSDELWAMISGHHLRGLLSGPAYADALQRLRDRAEREQPQPTHVLMSIDQAVVSIMETSEPR